MEKNKIDAIQIDYIISSRTIESILVSNQKVNKIYFIYNFEGIHFRLFDNTLDLLEFFDNQSDNFIDFNTENELENYLENIDLHY
jgi:hypothetical protein